VRVKGRHVIGSALVSRMDSSFRAHCKYSLQGIQKGGDTLGTRRRKNVSVTWLKINEPERQMGTWPLENKS